MKKYVTLQCSTCTRKKDELLDLTHYKPDRCTITLNCEGRLTPIGHTSDGTALLGVPPTGLSNWYARGSATISTTTLQADPLYDTSTGAKKQIVLAVSNDELGFTPSSSATVTLTLVAEQQTAKDYRQYTYRRTSSFTVINGVEDNQAKKVLRYSLTGSTPDVVEVYVNGVKRERFVHYDLYDGAVGSSVPPNSVLFLSTQTGSSTQVDIVVTKAATLSTLTLAFARTIADEARVGTGAWEGVDAVKSAALGQYSLFYCDFTEDGSHLALDVKLRVQEIGLTDGAPHTITQGAILLSRSKLFTQIDRQRSKWVPLNSLLNANYMVVKLVNGSRSLMVTETAAIDLFPPLEIVRFKDPTLTTNLTGNDDGAELDNTLIIGPDA